VVDFIRAFLVDASLDGDLAAAALGIVVSGLTGFTAVALGTPSDFEPALFAAELLGAASGDTH
jgi:hypothetical protein